MIPEPTVAEARDWVRELNGGTSPTHIVEAVDEDENRLDLVIKFRRIPGRPARDFYPGTGLACELICSIIGRTIGLPVPDYYVVEITPGFASARDGMRRTKLYSRNKGFVFGTPLLSEFADWPSAQIAEKTAILTHFVDTIGFDGAVFNGDRTQQNPNIMWNGAEEIRLIDHGLALAPVYNKGRDPDPAEPFPDPQFKDHATVPSLRSAKINPDSYEDVFLRWQDVVDDDYLVELRDCIPDDWERPHHDDLDQIFSFLRCRASSFRDMCSQIKQILS